MENKKRYLDVKAVSWKHWRGDKPNVRINCEVIEGPRKGEVVSFYGDTEGDYVAKTIEALKAFGWTGVDLETDLPDSEDGTDTSKGMGTLRAVAVAIDNTWNGKTTERIRFINAWKPRAGAAPAVASGWGKRYKALAKDTVVVTHPEAKITEDLEESPF